MRSKRSQAQVGAGSGVGSQELPRNKLLATLPDIALRRLSAQADTVSLAFGQVLYEPGTVKHFVYFPTSAYVSQISSLGGVPRIEVGLVGAEGMVGSSLVFGIDAAPLLAVVQGGGSALRLAASRFVYELARGPALRAVMNRYLYVRLSQLGQMTACTRFHTVNQRLARWLLMTRDRARADTFFLTHEYMAFMLGVRRVGVTEAATAMQSRKLIRYARGQITILNGRKLEEASCECYATAELTYERYMS